MPGYYASPGSSAGGSAWSWPLGHTSLHVCHHITYDLLPTHQVMELGQPNNGPRYHFCPQDMSLLLARSSSPICSVAAPCVHLDIGNTTYEPSTLYRHTLDPMVPIPVWSVWAPSWLEFYPPEGCRPNNENVIPMYSL